MTDTPRETPPTNELDHGLRNGGTVWSAYVRDMADRGRTVDLHQPATERAQRRWANQFTTPLTPPEMDLGEEPPAPIPARPYTGDPLDFVRLGERLDDADFTAAHDSVRPEIADAIQAATDEHAQDGQPLGMNPLAQLLRQSDVAGLGASTAPPALRAQEVTLDDIAEMPNLLRFDRELSEAELADFRRRFEEACTDTRLRVAERPVINRRPIVEKRPSIVGRIWRALRRWGR
ncbi:hypothetical protein [Amycolatopsis lurida]|uniref:hypothetical protein n=1 Tax=Amycolatopsis lurida TaxID=31959 RepID=UPI00365F299D